MRALPRHTGSYDDSKYQEAAGELSGTVDALAAVLFAIIDFKASGHT